MTRRFMHSLAPAALGASALATALGGVALGQVGRSTAVIIAVTDTLPSPHARAILMRDAARGEDIIILRRRNADVETLAGAFRMLARERRLRPIPRGVEVSTMQGVVVRGTLPSDRLAALTATLRKLSRQPTARIGTVGPGQWVKLPDPLRGR